MTYKVSSSAGQTQLREAVNMAMQYKNDDVLLEPGDYGFDEPTVFGNVPFGRIEIGGRLRNPRSVRWIFPNIKDRPLVTINADRQSWFHDFTVVGANTKPDYFEPSYQQADYLAAGITDRNIGIAVDDTALAGSWGTQFDRVFVEKCAVGFAVTPAGNSQNASGLKWIDCGSEKCDILMSWGQSQARANYVTRFTGGVARLAFTGMDHGKRQGVPPIIDGFEGSWIHTIGRFNSRFGQPLSWNNMWAERIKGIIHWMGTTGASGCIRNSTFVINMENPINPFLGENNGRECIAEAHSPFMFDNCNLGRNPIGKQIFTEGTSGMFRFINLPDFSKEFVPG